MTDRRGSKFPEDDFLRKFGAKIRTKTLTGPIERIRDAERAAVLAEIRRLRNLDSDPEHQRKVQEFIERIATGRHSLEQWRRRRRLSP